MQLWRHKQTTPKPFLTAFEQPGFEGCKWNLQYEFGQVMLVKECEPFMIIIKNNSDTKQNVENTKMSIFHLAIVLNARVFHINQYKDNQFLP